MSDPYVLTKTAMDTLSPVPYAASTEMIGTVDVLPDTYIIGSLISDVPEQHADNDETEKTVRMQLSIFSKDGLTGLPDTDSAMAAQGFRRGPARELPFDRESGHYGLARDYFILLDL